jgi:hypothetical protein
MRYELLTVTAALLAGLSLLTVVWHDWIEALFRVDLMTTRRAACEPGAANGRRPARAFWPICFDSDKGVGASRLSIVSRESSAPGRPGLRRIFAAPHSLMTLAVEVTQ